VEENSENILEEAWTEGRISGQKLNLVYEGQLSGSRHLEFKNKSGRKSLLPTGELEVIFKCSEGFLSGSRIEETGERGSTPAHHPCMSDAGINYIQNRLWAWEP
jgi:hypothetical protein